MSKSVSRVIAISAILAVATIGVAPASAAKPSVAQALKLEPIQDDVDYSRPDAAELESCTIDSNIGGGVSGWVVRDGAGRLLRRFVDTNRDNKVDLWCYYKDGIEVYRDVDANFNGKADQYRWLGTAGIRWGEDKDENGSLDAWNMISPEEVSSEVVAAIQNRDATRFQRLLITSHELKSLGLSDKQNEELSAKIAAAARGFANLAERQQVVEKQSQWIHFGGSRPGVIPAGTDGSTKDIVVYDNVSAVIETAGKHSQVAVGTLIRVNDTWRIIDLPQNLADGDVAAIPGGYFFNAALRRPSADVAANVPMGGVSPELQNLITQYEEIERSLATASPAQQAALNDRRADVLEKMVSAAEGQDEQLNWIRQFADTISAAAQTGSYPGGLKRLADFYDKLAKTPGADRDALAHVRYTYLSTQYSNSLQSPDADYAKIQEQWLADLAEFIKAFPKNEDAADAMMQLALAQEFAGKQEDAVTWYKRVAADFPSTTFGKKAVGARTRLESVGKTINLHGKTLEGKPVDLASYRGKVVLIHYWSTWCEPCKQELADLKNLQAKYGQRGFELIGVSLDSDRQALADYLQANRLPWPQLFEDGGLDGRLAAELGILTLPTMLLIGKDGSVLNRNVHVGELDNELGQQLR